MNCANCGRQQRCIKDIFTVRDWCRQCEDAFFKGEVYGERRGAKQGRKEERERIKDIVLLEVSLEDDGRSLNRILKKIEGVRQ